ncbi:ankyrin repeat-containing domain protein [Diplogelasinospora grovesii]|uniref:Ankyrin repeat-containing domain protein n=1 Tax=Diplogelasinospora grovesii TaxID=303347 RepID=A0AAN6S668_9PEZI|nr:ankyrin repeat-containing domain protein [Diplogelasinospora grovesii]
MTRSRAVRLSQCLSAKVPNLEAADNAGRTPLSWAAQSSCEDVILLLLSFGADLEARDNKGRPPLSRAAQYRAQEKDIIGRLLSLGAGPELTDNKGWTPARWAEHAGGRQGHGGRLFCKSHLD